MKSRNRAEGAGLRRIGILIALIAVAVAAGELATNGASSRNSVASQACSDSCIGPIDVSLIQLIANPALFDKKLVRTRGYLRMEFEGDALYLHKDDFDQMMSKNAVWLQIGDCYRDPAKPKMGGYALVEGYFHADESGHMGMFSGEIRSIQRMMFMPSRKYLDSANKAAAARPPVRKSAGRLESFFTNSGSRRAKNCGSEK